MNLNIQRKMTVMGAAPLIAVPSFLYLGAAIALYYSAPGPAMRVAGAVLIAFGLFMLLSSGLSVLKAFGEQRLLTDGFCAVFPNPMYPAYVLAIVRGLALVPAEDDWLREKFGAQYDEYRQRVLVKVF